MYSYKRPQSGTTPCASKRSSDDYSGGHHMAVYFPGQQVVIAHPMKNHGTGPCTNKFIPDNGNWILQATQEWLRNYAEMEPLTFNPPESRRLHGHIKLFDYKTLSFRRYFRPLMITRGLLMIKLTIIVDVAILQPYLQ